MRWANSSFDFGFTGQAKQPTAVTSQRSRAIVELAHDAGSFFVVRIEITDRCEDARVSEVALDRIKRYRHAFELRSVGPPKRVWRHVFEPGSRSCTRDDRVDSVGRQRAV